MIGKLVGKWTRDWGIGVYPCFHPRPLFEFSWCLGDKKVKFHRKKMSYEQRKDRVKQKKASFLAAQSA